MFARLGVTPAGALVGGAVTLTEGVGWVAGAGTGVTVIAERTLADEGVVFVVPVLTLAVTGAELAAAVAVAAGSGVKALNALAVGALVAPLAADDEPLADVLPLAVLLLLLLPPAAAGAAVACAAAALESASA